MKASEVRPGMMFRRKSWEFIQLVVAVVATNEHVSLAILSSKEGQPVVNTYKIDYDDNTTYSPEAWVRIG